MSSQIVRGWFNKLEEVLAAEAQLSGLLGHGTMIGDAREFLVLKMLRSFLPPSVHIGRGRVIDSEDHISNQIDIIIYDPRFPMLNVVGGGSLYFVEGVIGAIEVKSTINRVKLREALDNCNSVMSLSPYASDPHEMDQFVEMLMREQDLTQAQADQAAMEQMNPRTYIFGFKSTLSQKEITNTIGSWYLEKGEPVSQYQVRLPRIIASGNTIALTNDSWMRVTWDEKSLADIRTQYGSNARIVMQTYRTEKRFGWLALSLMGHAARRMGSHDFHTGVTFSLDGYQPGKLYHSELKSPRCIVWTGKGVG